MNKKKAIRFFSVMISVILAASAVTGVSAEGVTEETNVYGTVEDGIACQFIKGGRVYELPGIDTTGDNPFDFSKGLMYWGPSENSINNTALTKASAIAEVVTEDITAEKYLKMTTFNNEGKTNGLLSVAVKLPEAASDKKISVFYKMKVEGYSSGVAGYVRAYKSKGDGSGYTQVAQLSIKSTEWAVMDGNLDIAKWDTEYPYIAIGIVGNGAAGSSTDVCIKDLVVAYENEDGSYTPIFGGDIYNYYTKLPYYGVEVNGMTTASDNANKKIENMTVATDRLENGDFSQGLKYWAPRQSQYGTASEYAKVETMEGENIVTLLTEKSNYNGITTCYVRVPDAALHKEIFGLFEYKTDAASPFGSVKLVTSAEGAVKEQGDGISEFQFRTASDFTVGKTLSYTFSTSGSIVRIEIENDKNSVSMKNFGLVYRDEVGITNKALYANIDGTPYGYEMGDANADSTVNVCDLVRMKKYIEREEDKAVEIYFTAANIKKSVDSDATEAIDQKDLSAMRRLLVSAAAKPLAEE